MAVLVGFIVAVAVVRNFAGVVIGTGCVLADFLPGSDNKRIGKLYMRQNMGDNLSGYYEGVFDENDSYIATPNAIKVGMAEYAIVRRKDIYW